MITVTWMRSLAPLLLVLAIATAAQGEDAQSPSAKNARQAEKALAQAKARSTKSVSFMRDVAPILVQNCIACHNPKKSESKYVMTTFAQLSKGGKQGEGITLVPGKPDDCYLIDVLLPDAEPRMPYKLDPLPDDEIALVQRWVSEGARYDGTSTSEDWTFLLRKTQSVSIPDVYPTTVPITALAFAPDGRNVAASGYHEITLWKTVDGALDRRIAGLCERVHGITYSGNGKWLAIASGDPGQYGVARLWSVEPGESSKRVRDLAESQDAVFAVAFSPDSKKLATAGADRIIRVYETESGKLLAQIEDHADWIFDIAFSPDGKRLASASRDKTCKVFDVEKKESLVTFTGHGQPVYTIAFTPGGKAVTSGGEDNMVRIWSTDGEAKEVRQIGGFGGTVFKLRYSPDGKVLAVCCGDRQVRIYRANGDRLWTLQGHADWVYCVAFSPDSKTLASGSWDGELRLWNLADGKPIRTIIAAPGYRLPPKQAAR
jgi:WD40 repeat protein